MIDPFKYLNLYTCLMGINKTVYFETFEIQFRKYTYCIGIIVLFMRRPRELQEEHNSEYSIRCAWIFFKAGLMINMILQFFTKLAHFWLTTITRSRLDTCRTSNEKTKTWWEGTGESLQINNSILLYIFGELDKHSKRWKQN